MESLCLRTRDVNLTSIASFRWSPQVSFSQSYYFSLLEQICLVERYFETMFISSFSSCFYTIILAHALMMLASNKFCLMVIFLFPSFFHIYKFQFYHKELCPFFLYSFFLILKFKVIRGHCVNSQDPWYLILESVQF